MTDTQIAFLDGSTTLVSHREGFSRGVLPGAIATVLTVLTWPIQTLRPSSGLDPSWQLALHMAAKLHLRFGREILFTYGPLGFLSEPVLAYRVTGALAVTFTMLVHFALVLTVLVFARRWLRLLPAVGIAAAAGLISPFEPAELIPLIFIMWVLASDESVMADDKHWVRLIRIGALLAAGLVLIKFDTGIALTAVVACMILLGPQKARRTIEATTLFVLAVPVLWLFTTNQLGDLFVWLRGSVRLATGYGGAMSQELEGRSFEYLLAIILILALVVIALGRRRQSTLPRHVVALTVLITYFEFRHGFVRHEPIHSVPFFFFLALLPVAIRCNESNAGLARVYVISGLAMAAILPLPMNNPVADAFKGPGRAWNQVSTLLSSGRSERLIAVTKASMRQSFGLGPQLSSLVRGHTIHSDPVDVSLIWAYGFDWQPTPVFQSYSVYSSQLDATNAAFLDSQYAPDKIIRRFFLYFSPGNPPLPVRAIDNRNPYFEGPDSFLQTLCRYKELAATSEWQVLDRVSPRCGGARLVSSESIGAQPIRVPNPGPDEILFARIQIPDTIEGKLMGLLFKPLGDARITLDSNEYHLVQGTADDPLVICVPDSAGFSANFAPLQCPSYLKLRGVPRSKVQFYALPIARPM